MSEYWTEKDVIENAILDLQHERDDLKAEIARRDEQIAELTVTTHSQTLRNAELSRFVWWVYQVYARNVQELTSGITEACTYETEEKAEKGKYGLPIRCWKYVRHLEEYTAGIYNGTYLDSETSTGVKDPPAGHLEGCEEVHWDCRIAQLEKKLARRDDLIKRLVEDGERLASTYVIEVFPHEWVCRGGCHHWARFGEQIEHSPDCPITLHRALMKELEEK